MLDGLLWQRILPLPVTYFHFRWHLRWSARRGEGELSPHGQSCVRIGLSCSRLKAYLPCKDTVGIRNTRIRCL